VFALDYPAKTQAVDNLTNSFRPAFTNAALAQSKTDLSTATAFATDFQQKAARHPRPDPHPRDSVSRNVVNFRLADAIPTRSLPASDIEWQLVLPAMVAIAAGGLAFAGGDRRRDRQPAVRTQTAVPISA
jgi:hypothetical protein